MLYYTETAIVPNVVWRAFAPVQTREPLGVRARRWMDEYEKKCGKQPTFTLTAEHFGVHRTTISRNVKKHDELARVRTRLWNFASKD